MNKPAYFFKHTRKIISLILAVIFVWSASIFSPASYAADLPTADEGVTIEEPLASEEPQPEPSPTQEPQPSEEPIPSEEPEPSEEPGFSTAADGEEPDVITDEDGKRYARDEVIVKFKSKLSMSAMKSAVGLVGREIKKADNDVVVAIVPEGETVQSTIEMLEAQQDVEYAQPNYYYTVAATVNDPYFTQQWHLSNINVPAAWDMTMGSSDIKVAVLDTGIDNSHSEFSGQIYAQQDVVNWDNNAQDDSSGNAYGHGTHVAGIIAAKTNNGSGVAGVAPGVKLIIVDVFDGNGAYSDDIASGIQYAVSNGAKVINMSFGGWGYDAIMEAAINDAVSAGVVCVAAAGNEETDIYVSPSDYESVISVIAIDESDNKADFSNYGAAKDISAPGVDVLSTFPGGYAWADGTSMAAPVVSGVVALILSMNPSLSVNQIKDILYGTAEDLGTPGKDNIFGYGKINAQYAVASANGTDKFFITVKSSNNAFGTVAGGGLYSSGDSVTLTATPSAEYSFVRWVSGGAEVSANATYTFSASASASYTAEFRKNAYTISVSTNNASFGSVEGGGNYEHGAYVALKAWPKSGYRFVRWHSSGVTYSTNQHLTFYATQDLSLVAEFKRLTQVNFNYSKTDASAYGRSDGTISISSWGGDGAPHQYAISGGSDWSTSGYFTNLAPGSYIMFVRDSEYQSNIAYAYVTLGYTKSSILYAPNKIPSKVNAGLSCRVTLPSTPKGYTAVAVAYSSSNPSVAAMDPYGNMTFLAGGKVTITTKLLSLKQVKPGYYKEKVTTVKRTFTVKQPVSSVSLNINNATIARKSKLKLTASVAPSTASNKKVKWKSSNSKVASVSSSGVVTGKAGGTAVITCTANDGSGASASCTVTVTPIYPSSIKLNKSTITVKRGKTTTLKATVLPKTTDYKTVVWSSSNNAVATVNAKGKVTAHASGTALITAQTSNGLLVSCWVNVP